MTDTIERQRLPWQTGRWTPMEGGHQWQDGMRAEYAALVGTPAELVAAMVDQQRAGADQPADVQPHAVYTSGFTGRSPRQYGRDLLAEAQQERPGVAVQLVAVVWDGWPGYRWDGSRNQALRDPDHALAIVTGIVADRDHDAAVRSVLLARMRAKRAEQLVREAAIGLWQVTRNIAHIHGVTGLARTTIYTLLRGEGIEPTAR